MQSDATFHQFHRVSFRLISAAVAHGCCVVMKVLVIYEKGGFEAQGALLASFHNSDLKDNNCFQPQEYLCSCPNTCLFTALKEADEFDFGSPLVLGKKICSTCCGDSGRTRTFPQVLSGNACFLEEGKTACRLNTGRKNSGEKP